MRFFPSTPTVHRRARRSGCPTRRGEEWRSAPCAKRAVCEARFPKRVLPLAAQRSGLLALRAQRGPASTFPRKFSTKYLDTERCDRRGSIMDCCEAAARRARHAMPGMPSQRCDRRGSIMDCCEAAARRARHAMPGMPSQTGLYDYGLRHYEPPTGRWISRDPIGERGGANLYGFCGNGGQKQWDLLGLVDIDLNPSCYCGDLDCKPEKDTFSGFSKNAPDKPEWLTILGHGTSNSIRDDRPGRKHRSLRGYPGAEELSQMIKSHPDFKSGKIKVIILYSCDTGAGWNSFAQKLSTYIPNVRVAAPTKPIWCHSDGTYEICGQFYEGRANPRDKGEARSFINGFEMRKNHDGVWKKIPNSRIQQPVRTNPINPNDPNRPILVGNHNGEPIFEIPGSSSQKSWSHLTQEQQAMVPPAQRPK